MRVRSARDNPLCFLSFFPLDSRLLNLFNWNQRRVVASLASLVPHEDKGGVLAHSFPCLWQVEYSTTLRNRLRKHGNPVPPPLRERLARGNHIPLSPRGSVIPKKSHSPSVTARRCFFIAVAVSFPFRHREPADFAGVAASVSKTEIATLTKYKSVRSQ